MCPVCSTHVRTLNDSQVPVGREFYIFFPVRQSRGANPYMGWVHHSKLKVKMKFDERNEATAPKEYGHTNRQDEIDYKLTEAAARRSGSRF